jgi:hypothetical protein
VASIVFVLAIVLQPMVGCTEATEGRHLYGTPLLLPPTRHLPRTVVVPLLCFSRSIIIIIVSIIIIVVIIIIIINNNNLYR